MTGPNVRNAGRCGNIVTGCDGIPPAFSSAYTRRPSLSGGTSRPVSAGNASYSEGGH